MRTYRASALGYSLEALVASHLGYEPISAPDWLQERFDEGTRLEPLILDKLRNDGWKIDDQQAEVEIEVIPGVAKVVGHLDGMAPEGVIEAKSMNAKTWRTFKERGWDCPGLIQKYKWQCSAYMLATQQPLYLVAWNKDTEELHIELADVPFYTIADIANKLQAAEDHINAGTLPEGCTDYPCPFFHLHAPDDNPVIPADSELDYLMEQWLSLDNHEKAYKKEKDDIRAAMLAIAGVDEAANVRGRNGVTITTTWQEEKEIVSKRKAGWVTRVAAPRKKNHVAE